MLGFDAKHTVKLTQRRDFNKTGSSGKNQLCSRKLDGATN